MKKKKIRSDKGVVKGTSTSLMLSIAIHAVLFLLAGMLVVFTVVKKEEQVFEPPKTIERPKMKLKKPKIKVKKSSKPKSTKRIVATQKRATMPDMVLPEMGGLGTGMGDGIDGFDMMPDMSTASIFGAGQSIGNDFEGTLYDFKRDHSGRTIPMDPSTLTTKLSRFIKGGWNTSYLSGFYRAPQKVYATSIMIPPTKSMFGPAAFGEVMEGWAWMVHYKGVLVYHEDIKFRFWGYGDDLMMVRVNGEMVLNANYHQDGGTTDITNIGGSWDSSSSDDAMYWYGTNKARVGDWIELKAGEPFEMEVVIGEVPGGVFCAMLTVQVDGVEYEKNRQGGPILPMFMTEIPSRSLQDIILRDLVQGEACATNFYPVFRDYHVAQKTKSEEPDAENEMAELKKSEWTNTDGTIIEGEYLSVVAGNIILETLGGEQLKSPIAALCKADREYIELMNPPDFSINFLKQSVNRSNRYKLSTLEMGWGMTLPRVNDFTFGAKAQQRGVGSYNHEVTLEYFALGQELIGDKYVLLDRQSSTFNPAEENGEPFEFYGNAIEFLEYDMDGQMRGNRPSDNVIILRDKRNEVIKYYASKSWLWENIEALKELPVGAYLDKTCTRVYPTSPKPDKW